MAAGRPTRHHDPLVLGTERGQPLPEEIDAGMNLGDDLIERGVRRERVTYQRDIDAMRHRALGEQRECLFRPVLPVTTMDKEQRRHARARLEKIDAVALARSVSEIKMRVMALAQLGRFDRPGCDDLAAALDGLAVVETAVKLLPAHLAPVQRVERRGHAKTPEVLALPACRKMV